MRSVALKYHSRGLTVIAKGILGSGTNFASPADAIKSLKLTNLVIRPISLHNIILEHIIQAG